MKLSWTFYSSKPPICLVFSHLSKDTSSMLLWLTKHPNFYPWLPCISSSLLAWIHHQNQTAILLLTLPRILLKSLCLYFQQHPWNIRCSSLFQNLSQILYAMNSQTSQISVQTDLLLSSFYQEFLLILLSFSASKRQTLQAPLSCRVNPQVSYYFYQFPALRFSHDPNTTITIKWI